MHHKDKETVEPASNNTMPPQFTDPRHQMYEGMLPQRSFNKQSKPVLVKPNIQDTGAPHEYMGVPVHMASSLKGQVSGVNKQKYNLHSIGNFVEKQAAYEKLVIVKDMKTLNQKFPDQASLAGKKLIIIGGVPHASIGNKTFVVLPPSVAEKVGLVVGSVKFPVNPRDNKIPLFC